MMKKTIKNDNGAIKNLNLYNDILKKFVYELQVPIAAAKIGANGVYRAYTKVDNTRTVDQIIADSREWAQDCLPDAQHRDRDDDGTIKDVDLFLRITHELIKDGIPALEAKVQARGIYDILQEPYEKERGTSIREVIRDSDEWAMENYPDLHK